MPKLQKILLNRSTKVIFAWIWLIGLSITALAYLIHQERNQTAVEDETKLFLDQAVELVKSRFGLYEYGLLATRGAAIVAGPQQIDRTTFERYINSRNVAREFPGALGYGYIRRVSPDEEPLFVKQAQADGAPEFKIKTLTPHNKDRFVIQYIYPQAPNKAAIGLDIGSETNRRNAAINAAVSGDVTLTAPITLVQYDDKPRRGFLILLPVYDLESSQATPEIRRDDVVGWAYAPLVVDDVLFELSPFLDKVALTIQDKSETTPFFNSLPDAEDLSDIAFSGDVEFMGRDWNVTVSARDAMSTSLGLIAPFWVAILGLLVTLIVSFVWIIVSSEKAAQSYESNANINVGINEFLSSKAFRKPFQLVLLMSLVALALITFSKLEREYATAGASLMQNADYSKVLINVHQKDFREGLALLSSTSPVDALIRSLATGIDPETQITFEEWRTRLEEIFRAYMLSAPDVFQVRLIQANEKGQELVKVERKNNQIIAAGETELQSKGNRDYFIQAIGLKASDVLVTSIEPNIENGVIESPLRPTIRYIKHLKSQDGNLVALLTINIDAESLLTQLRELASENEIIYLTDGRGEFLLSGDPSNNYGSYFGKPYGWGDAFSLQKDIFVGKNINAWQGVNGRFISSLTTINPNDGSTIGQLNIRPAYALSEIYKRTGLTLLKFTVFFVVLITVGFILFYFYWANNHRKFVSKRIQEELNLKREKDNLFESVTELSPEAMVIADGQGNIVLVNSQTEKLFGYAREQLLGQPVDILLPKELRTKHASHVQNYLKEPVIREMGQGQELYAEHADGTNFPIEVSLSPIQLDNKVLVAASVRNIASRKQDEAVLKNAIAEANSANQAKSTFLANMSHEIRTPLNAVIGLTHLLEDSSLSQSQSELVRKIQLSGRSLLGIVNDVLDLAKIEANEMTVSSAPFNLHQFLNDIYSRFSNEAEKKNIDLIISLDPNLPTGVISDSRILGQILTNFLSNAIKFTSAGFIHISADCVATKNKIRNYQMVKFSVKDSGIGIDKRVQEKIFQPFSQAEESTSRRYGGTGLGLTITQTLSDLLEGGVGLESEPGIGSCFWLRLPLMLTEVDDLLINSSVALLDVLIAEDEEADRLHLEQVAKKLGWKVGSVDNGKALIDEIQSRLANNIKLPDVLMVDWNMPELDGLSALEKLHAKLGRNQLPAVLMISLFDRKNILDLDKNHLIDTFLNKPITPSDLFNAVNDVVVKHTGNIDRVLTSTKTEAIKARWLPGVRILVVDDSQINLEVVGSILSRNGAEVETADNGALALEILRQKKDYFDVVIMDVQMPVMDGLETVSRIRSDLNLPKLPVAAFTAGTFEEERKRALAAGMDTFLTKPIEPESLIHTLRRMVEVYRDKTIQIESISDEPTDNHYEDWPEIEGLTNNSGMFQGDKALFVQALNRLLAENENLELSADESLAAIDSEQARMALASQLHKLRGTAGTIGAKSLYQHASELEISLRKGGTQLEALRKYIADDIASLRTNSAAFLNAWADLQAKHEVIDLSDVTPMRDADIEALIEKLDDHDLAASSIFKQSANSIRSLIGHSAFAELEQMIQTLDYQAAAEILRKSLNDK